MFRGIFIERPTPHKKWKNSIDGSNLCIFIDSCSLTFSEAQKDYNKYDVVFYYWSLIATLDAVGAVDFHVFRVL